MPRSRIMTSDVNQRKEAKTRLLNKVVASLEAPESETRESMILLLPHNYQDMSEAELQNKLAFTVELNHTPNSTLLALDILFGRISQPDHVEFQLSYLTEQPEPVKVAPVRVEKPVEVKTVQETMKRRQFKVDLSEKIKASEAISLQEEVQPRLKVKVPIDFKSLSSNILYEQLVTLNLLTPEQAQDLFATLGGRKINTKFDMVWESETVRGDSKPVPKTVRVTVPNQFKILKVTDQYAYLVRQLALAPEEANDVIDILKGKPQISSTIFEIEED
jgi:hypothetical protein